jgi:hypothetical protein
MGVGVELPQTTKFAILKRLLGTRIETSHIIIVKIITNSAIRSDRLHESDPRFPVRRDALCYVCKICVYIEKLCVVTRLTMCTQRVLIDFGMEP